MIIFVIVLLLVKTRLNVLNVSSSGKIQFQIFND